MSMDKWDEAAKELTVAIRELCEYYSPTSDYIPPSASINKTIANHHADLRRTFNKLVELVKMQNAQRIHREAFTRFQDHVDANRHNTGVAINRRLAELLADPDIQAAMKGENG